MKADIPFLNLGWRQFLACVFGIHLLGRPKVDLYPRCVFSLCHCYLPCAPNYHTALTFLISSTSILSLFTFSGNLTTVSSELNVVRFSNYQVISSVKICPEMSNDLEWDIRVPTCLKMCSRRYYVHINQTSISSYNQAKDHYFTKSHCLSWFFLGGLATTESCPTWGFIVYKDCLNPYSFFSKHQV